MEVTSPEPQALSHFAVTHSWSDAEIKEECCTAAVVCRSPGFAGNELAGLRTGRGLAGLQGKSIGTIIFPLKILSSLKKRGLLSEDAPGPTTYCIPC